MLIGFRFKNFRSFYGENFFSMKANAETRFRELNTMETGAGGLNKSAFVLGVNGSGKSNFIAAFNYMKNTVLAELPLQSGMIANLDPFMFSTGAKETPSVFEAEFIVGYTVYEYGFELLRGEVNREYLYKKTKKKTPVFIRTSPDFEDISLSEEMYGVYALTKNTGRNALFIHWAYAGANETALTVRRWFENTSIFDTEDTRRLMNATIEYLEDNRDGKSKTLDLLQRADPSVVDFDFAARGGEEQSGAPGDNPKKSFAKRTLPIRKVTLHTKHRVYDENWEETGMVATSLNLESAGTRKLFELAGPVLRTLENGGVLFVDEIDSRLHLALVRLIMAMFNSATNNPKGAQLICNSNDAHLLDEDNRRDQVYFTEKDEYGVSKLYALADLKGMRKGSKYLKQYLLRASGTNTKIRDYYASF